MEDPGTPNPPCTPLMSLDPSNIFGVRVLRVMMGGIGNTDIPNQTLEKNIYRCVGLGSTCASDTVVAFSVPPEASDRPAEVSDAARTQCYSVWREFTVC